MDLEELRAFLQVVESGSFLAAADDLQVSRTTLRRRVGSLEARAGVPLLESTQQGVVLTDAGRVLARRGRELHEEAGALLASVREVGQEPAGVLRAALPVGLPPELLAALFGWLREAYPRLHVELRYSEDPLSESLIGVDMAVHFGGAAPSRGKWISYEIVQAPERLLASAAYLARRGTPASIEDLSRHELLAWRPPGDDARAWPIRGGGSFSVDPALVSTDIHAVRACALAGLGIALVPDAGIPEPGGPSGLVPVLPDLVGRARALRVTVPEALADLPKIRMVLERTRSFLGEL